MSKLWLVAPEGVRTQWKSALAPLKEALDFVEQDEEAFSKMNVPSSAEEALYLFYLPLQSPQAEQTLQHLLTQGASVLVVAESSEEQAGLAWLEQGAKGYLASPVSADKLQQAVKSLLHGYVWVGQSLMQQMVKRLVSFSPQVRLAFLQSQCHLTDREVETVKYILEGKSNAQIAEAMHISPRTVKAHLHHIFEKTGVPDRLALVLWVVGLAQKGA